MAGVVFRITGVPTLAAGRLIRLYQILASPFPSPCRHVPSCSAYALEAVNRHGAAKGIWLGILRIARCQPFSRGGYDPVP